MANWNAKCECGTKKSYNEKWDAYYCKKCNKWLESICNARTCDYCKDRPEKPLKGNKHE